MVISGILSGAGEARADVTILSACGDLSNGTQSFTCTDLDPIVIEWQDSTNQLIGGGLQSCYSVFSENANLLETVGFPCTNYIPSHFKTSPLPPFQIGTHHITVRRLYLAGDSPPSIIDQTILFTVIHAPAATTTTVTSDGNPAGSHAVNLYAHVTDNGPTGYPLSGTLTYKVDGQDYCTASVAGDGSVGACATNLAAGTRNITATYNGDANHYISNSDALAQVVAVAPSSITATAGTPQQTPIGTAFGATLQVQVEDASGFPVPYQTVTYSAPSSGATASLDSTTSVTDNNGYAAVTATANNTLGAYVVTASVVGVGPLASFALNNQLAPNIITFAKPADKTFEDTPPALDATASSNLAVTYTSRSAAVCTVTTAGVITFNTAGACSITASQAGDGSYAAAVDVTKTFTIDKHTQIITFNPPATQTFAPAGTVALVAFGDNSDNPVTFASTSTGVCTVSGSTVTFVSAGTCAITASQAGNVSYLAAPDVSRSFAIGQASQTISFSSPATQTYVPNGTMGLSATGGASGLPVTFASTSTGVCTVLSSTVTFVSAGTCAITASQAGNVSYLAAPDVSKSFAISQAAQVISFTPPATQAYSPTGTIVLVAIGGASGNPVTFASTTTSVCTTGGTNGATVMFVTAGSCAITASQAGNISYSAAPNVPKNFAINQAAQSISFTSAPPNVGYVKGPLYIVAATGGASSNPVTFAIDPASVAVCSIAGTKVSLQAAGTCKINASQAGNTDYAAATASQSFTVQDTIGPATKAIGGFISDRANLMVSNLFDMGRQVDRLNHAQQAQGGPNGSSNLVDNGKSDLSPMLQSSRLGGGPTGGSITAASLGAAGGGSIGQQDMMGFESMLYNYLKAASESGNPAAFNFSGPMDMHANFGGGSDTASFKTSLSQMMNWEQQKEQKEMSGLGFSSGLSGSVFMPFDIWTEANYSTYSGTRSGQFGMVTVGVDYVFNPNILAGFYGQFDAMNQTTGTALSGKGSMVGSYATARLSDTVFLQGRVGWGKSANGINTTGAVTDIFGSTRWLVSSSLSGRWKATNGLAFAPTASFTYFEDKSDSYVDSFGVTIPSVATTLGQFKLSPELSYGYSTDSGWWIEPNIAPELIWNFASTNVDGLGALDGTATGPTGLRGRVKAGLNLKTRSGIAIGASGSYDGIGSDSYSSISAQATVNVPLN